MLCREDCTCTIGTWPPDGSFLLGVAYLYRQNGVNGLEGLMD